MNTHSITTGLVLVNLGTPEQAEPAAVKTFLSEFLSDPRVVQAPRWFWLPLLHGVILPLRSPRVARLYESIWLPEGSPLKVITENQVTALQNKMEQSGKHVAVVYAMTYGRPSIKEEIRKLEDQGVSRIVVLPLYPQFSWTTTGSVLDQLEPLKTDKMNVVQSYHNHPSYIEALANSVRMHWQRHGRGQKLLISCHGIPASYISKGDPYQEQCQLTANLLSKSLGLNEEEWSLSYQSRFGPSEWIKPYTDKLLQNWAEQGVSTVDVVTPSFSVDCLETLEEIAKENCQLFIENGGKNLRLVPCLNDSEDHIDFLFELFQENVE